MHGVIATVGDGRPDGPGRLARLARLAGLARLANLEEPFHDDAADSRLGAAHHHALESEWHPAAPSDRIPARLVGSQHVVEQGIHAGPGRGVDERPRPTSRRADMLQRRFGAINTPIVLRTEQHVHEGIDRRPQARLEQPVGRGQDGVPQRLDRDANLPRRHPRSASNELLVRGARLNKVSKRGGRIRASLAALDTLAEDVLLGTGQHRHDQPDGVLHQMDHFRKGINVACL